MTKRKRGKDLNEKRFEGIRKLIDAGLTTKQIKEFTGYSQVTIYNVKKCATWDNYLGYRKKQIEYLRARKNNGTGTKVTVTGNGGVNAQYVYTQDSNTQLLASIDATLKKLLMIEERKEASRNEYRQKRAEYQDEKRSIWDRTFGR